MSDEMRRPTPIFDRLTSGEEAERAMQNSPLYRTIADHVRRAEAEGMDALPILCDGLLGMDRALTNTANALVGMYERVSRPIVIERPGA